MNNNREEAVGAEAHGRFHTVQPLRDLESNWGVDLAKNLEEYLLKICSGELTGEEEGHLSINFAEAALLLQGSVQVYSRKVEYLYSLVIHALEFVSQKGQQNQTGDASVTPEGNVCKTAADEENDSFWGLDDIPVEAKISLDGETCRDTILNHFVKPPANLVVLEGDCLEAAGDGGELESYMLATNDLYQDFILLDLCDATVVDEYAHGKAANRQNGPCRNSSMSSKSRKIFQSPTMRSEGLGHKSSTGKKQDVNFCQSPLNTHEFKDNDCDIEMNDGYLDHSDADDSENDEDPWKPLNPYEPGNLKVQPFKKVKAVKRERVNASKRIPITQEFPLARLHGTISTEFTEIWEQQRVAAERMQESPPLFEKLRQSLVLEGHEKFDDFCKSNNSNEDNGYDCGGPDFDIPENMDMYEDVALQPEEHDDDGIHSDTNEGPSSCADLEDLCRSHLDALLASIAENENQTELAARVSNWKQRIEQNLEEQESHQPFDIHEYGERVLDKLYLKADSGNTVSFADVVEGQERHDVARTFSALLQLVNNGNVMLEKNGIECESTCYTAVDPFNVCLLGHDSKNEPFRPLSAKKRAKSPRMRGNSKFKRPGKENRPNTVLSNSGSTSVAVSSQLNCKFSVKLGKTPEGKRRRRSRLIEQMDLHSRG